MNHHRGAGSEVGESGHWEPVKSHGARKKEKKITNGAVNLLKTKEADFLEQQQAVNLLKTRALLEFTAKYFIIRALIRIRAFYLAPKTAISSEVDRQAAKLLRTSML